MSGRRFLNLVTENCSTGLYSLRRLKLDSQLFYPSTAAAESAMARREAAIKATAKKRAGYQPGFQSLSAMASSLGPRLPAPVINLQPAGPTFGDEVTLDFVALLGDESKILCGDSCGRTSLYHADSHSILTVPSLRGAKGPDAIPITVSRRAAAGAAADDWWSPVYDSLYVMNRNPHPEFADYLFEELNYGAQIYSIGGPPAHQWKSLPPPPFIHHPACKFPVDIGAHAVVGSKIYVSPIAQPVLGTYSFDTDTQEWKRAGDWMLPFFGKAEHVPELNNLWFGLSPCWPFHLCAADLSALLEDVQPPPPPTVLHTWMDLDMPKNWSPWQLHIVNLGCGRFCVVKLFHCMDVPDEDEEEEEEEEVDVTDGIFSEFAILTGVEVVVLPGEGGLRMIKHKSRYHIFEDHSIHWVL